MGLTTLHPGQPPQKLTPALRARILARTQEPPPDGSTHWSLRKMVAVIGVGKELVRRVWKEADLKPHRMERYLASKDPEFEQKAAAIIGLYLNPPQHAAVFCVDEKTAIQALDPQGPAAAVIAGTRRTARARVLSPWHAVIVRRTQSADRQCHGLTAARPHQHRVREVPGRGRVQLPGRSAGAYHSRQPERSQGSPGARVSRRASERGVSLHADLFVVAQSSRDLVFKTAARGHRPRHLYVSCRSSPQTSALHSVVR